MRSLYSLEVDAPDKRTALEQTAQIVRRRLGAAHIAATVAVEGEHLVVDLPTPDAETTLRAGTLVVSTATVEHKIVDNDAPLMRDVAARAAADPEAIAAGIAVDTDTWRTDREYRYAYLVAADRGAITGRQVLQQYLANVDIPADHELVFERIDGRPASWRSYYVRRTPLLRPESLERAEAMADPQTQAPLLYMELDDAGAKELAEVTRANVGRRLALIVDGVIKDTAGIAAPLVDGKLQMTMPDATFDEVRDRALVLASGALPGRLRLETVTRLGHGQPFDARR